MKRLLVCLLLAGVVGCGDDPSDVVPSQQVMPAPFSAHRKDLAKQKVTGDPITVLRSLDVPLLDANGDEVEEGAAVTDVVIVNRSRFSFEGGFGTSVCIDDDHLEHVSHMPQVEEIYLGQTDVTDDGLIVLQDLPRLRLLVLPERTSASGYKHLSGLRNLEKLVLNGNLPSAVQQVPGQPLKSLTQGLEHLAELPKLRELHLLGYGPLSLTSEAMKQIGKVKNLEVLWLRYLPSRELLSEVPGLKQLHILSEYTLSNEIISEIGEMKNLEAVSMGRSPGTALGTRGHIEPGSLLCLNGLPRLKELSLLAIIYDDLEQLKGLVSVEELTLDYPKIRDADLVHLKGLTNLTGLRLQGGNFYINIAESIRAGITDASLLHLKGITSLEMLSLRGETFTDAGLLHVKEMTSLRSLVLAGTGITDAGLENLKELTHLESLDLSGCNISDAGIVHLKELTTLDWLSLGGDYTTQTPQSNYVKVTGQGLTELQKALPDCKIIYTP